MDFETDIPNFSRASFVASEKTFSVLEETC
jgi:hypothetical protein